MTGSTPSELLGICIPAYKRPELLAGCLESAIEAARPYQVPIFVADDSTDDTNSAVLERASALYPLIHVNRNAENLGIDLNIGHCVDLCTCEYALMIGEDDRFRPQAVGRVLEVLSRDWVPPPLIFVNYSHVTADYKNVFMERRVPLAADAEIPADEFLREWAWASGFIGACVVNVRQWRDTPLNPFLGTYFAHVGRIMTFSAGKQIHMIAEPLVLNRAGNFSSYTWAEQAFEVFYGFESLLETLAGLYGRRNCDAALVNCRIAFRHRSLRWLILTRAENVFNMDVYRKYRLGEDASIAFRAAAVLIAVLPAWMSRLVRLLGRDLPRALRSRAA